MESCVFCEIVAGNLPSDKVAETERSLAFRDLNPVAPTHVLVIPKRHVESIGHLDAEMTADVADLVTTIQEVTRVEGIDESGYRVVANTGTHGAQSVFHLHFHVIGGRQLGWPPE
ncbi:MAG: histidine triad nucleotide-binding protein [Actinobacteria bacterium]|nr:histidine triad nucleotide-binding protein [Actinomycetota bacterium]MCB9388466.1 histidine triad nucleotide-binding protein [Acidimicrobiia bacterium]